MTAAGSSRISTGSYLKSDVVLERTIKLSQGFETSANLEALEAAKTHGEAYVSSLKQQQIMDCKIEALVYAHRITVAEKRFRTLNESAEKLFKLMVDLALDVKALSYLKEIMYQYRNMSTASSNPKAFVDVINQILAYMSNNMHKLEIEESFIEYGKTANLIEMSFFPEQKTYQHLEYLELLNFFKETLKNILEVTRKLEHYEVEYHKVAKELIILLTKYKCKDEIKRLCGTLRNHINQIVSEDQMLLKPNKSSKPTISRSVKIASFNNPKTLQLNISTKTCIFRSCIDLDIWREAYFTLEETQQLMSIKSIYQLNAPRILFDFLINVAELCLNSYSLDKETLPTFSIHHKYAALALLKAFDILNRTHGPSEDLKKQTAIKTFILVMSISESINDNLNIKNTVSSSYRIQRISNLLKIMPEIDITKSSLTDSILSNQLMNHLPKECKELTKAFLSNQYIIENSADLIEKFKIITDHLSDGQLYLDRLNESLAVMSLQIILTSYSSIYLHDLHKIVELPTKKNDKDSLELLIKISNHLNVPIRINKHLYEHNAVKFEIRWYLQEMIQISRTKQSFIHHPNLFFPQIFMLLDTITNEMKIEKVVKDSNLLNASIINQYYKNKESYIEFLESNIVKIENQEAERLYNIEKEKETQKIEAQQKELEFLHRQKEEARYVDCLKEEEKHNLVREALRINQAEELIKDLNVSNSEININGYLQSKNAFESFDKLNTIKLNKDLENIDRQIASAKKADQNFDHLSRIVTIKSVKANQIPLDTPYTMLDSISGLKNYSENVYLSIKNIMDKKKDFVSKQKQMFMDAYHDCDTHFKEILKLRESKIADELSDFMIKKEKIMELEKHLSELESEKEKLRLLNDENKANQLNKKSSRSIQQNLKNPESGNEQSSYITESNKNNESFHLSIEQMDPNEKNKSVDECTNKTPATLDSETETESNPSFKFRKYNLS